jgi:hypothetical protein
VHFAIQPLYRNGERAISVGLGEAIPTEGCAIPLEGFAIAPHSEVRKANGHWKYEVFSGFDSCRENSV